MFNPACIRTAACILAAAAAAYAIPAAQAQNKGADDPSFLAFSAGYFDINDDFDAAEGRVEYRHRGKLWIFKPFVGAMATSDQAAYGYAGVLVDVYLGRRWVVTPSFAPGLYRKGDGKDLGGAIEFKSQLEISYRFDDRSRLGLGISHMSNASIYDRNPGTETLFLTYALPLGGK
jgi:lipid A 3-O-deacylase